MTNRFSLCLALGVLVPSAATLLLYYQQHFKSRKNSSFKLLKLPWLAFQEVLKSMDPGDIVMLSLCSKKTLNILKTRKAKVNWLFFVDYDNGLAVYSRQSFDTKDLVFFARTVSISDEGFDENQLKVVRIGGIDVRCLLKKYGIVYINTTKKVVQQAVNNRIHELFTVKYIDLELWDSEKTAKHISMKRYFEVPEMNDANEENYMTISGVTDLRLYDVNSGELEEILWVYYPNLKSLRIDGRISGLLSATSQIFYIENVLLYYYNQSAPFFWKNFRGRYAVDSGMVMRALRASDKEWNRPQTYEYWSRLIGTIRHSKDIIRLESDSFIEFMDFERKTDQKMATLIILRTGGFGFIVWD